MLLACVVLVFPKVRGWNDGSRMATVQAIVEQNSLAIGQTAFAETGDKVYINGTFYSDKPPAPSFLGALAYWPIHAAGANLDKGVNLAYFLVTLLTVKLFWISGLYCFYRLSRETDISLQGSLWLTLALGVGSLYLTWSSTFNNHSLAASSLIIGFYFFAQAARGDSIRRNLFLSGLFFGFAGVSDIPTAIFYTGFAAIVVSAPQFRQNTLFFLAPLALTFGPYFAANWHMHESIVPVQIVKAYFDYPGSPWTPEFGTLSGTEVNSLSQTAVYGLGLLLGPKGFLLYNPLLWLSFAGAVSAARRGERFWKEARVIIAGSIIIFVYYASTTSNYSGFSYSIRWFVPLLPLLFFLSYPVIDGILSRRHRLFFALLVSSVVISTIGLINPWADENVSRFPLIANLRLGAGWMRWFLGRLM